MYSIYLKAADRNLIEPRTASRKYGGTILGMFSLFKNPAPQAACPFVLSLLQGEVSEGKSCGKSHPKPKGH